MKSKRRWLALATTAAAVAGGMAVAGLIVGVNAVLCVGVLIASVTYLAAFVWANSGVRK